MNMIRVLSLEVMARIVTVLYVLLSGSDNDPSANRMEERERGGGRMRMTGVSGARQRQERSEHHTHKVLSRSQTCRAHRSRPSSLQGLLPEVFRRTRTSVHARWIVLLLHLLGLPDI